MFYVDDSSGGIWTALPKLQNLRILIYITYTILYVIYCFTYVIMQSYAYLFIPNFNLTYTSKLYLTGSCLVHISCSTISYELWALQCIWMHSGSVMRKKRFVWSALCICKIHRPCRQLKLIELRWYGSMTWLEQTIGSVKYCIYTDCPSCSTVPLRGDKRC